MAGKFRSGAIGFTFGIAFTPGAAQAARPSQHEHQTAPSAQTAPVENMDQMHKMMEHMKLEGMKKDQPAPHQ